MSCYFLIAMFFLLCMHRSEQYNTCKVLKDPTLEELNISVEGVEVFNNDIFNVTKHLNEYISKLRKTLKDDNIPPDTVKYYLFTSHNKEPLHIKATKSFCKTIPYNRWKPLAFVIHGYDPEGIRKDLMVDLIQSVVNLNKYNVIAVDYTELINVLLSAAVPKVYLAAKNMARFLRLLMAEKGTRRRQIHLIGLSLGGHIAGMIGRFIPGLGRISGIEPGGVFFNFFPKDLRLDRSDANFVDVIHTNDDRFPIGLGFYQPCGHLDFYLNGGLFQPGCTYTAKDNTITTKEEIARKICSHQRSAFYYAESTCLNCVFIGTLCDSYENYEKGLCTNSESVVAVMGEYATKPLVDLPENSKFFLNTNDHYPFCKFNPLE